MQAAQDRLRVQVRTFVAVLLIFLASAHAWRTSRPEGTQFADDSVATETHDFWSDRTAEPLWTREAVSASADEHQWNEDALRGGTTERGWNPLTVRADREPVYDTGAEPTRNSESAVGTAGEAVWSGKGVMGDAAEREWKLRETAHGGSARAAWNPDVHSGYTGAQLRTTQTVAYDAIGNLYLVNVDTGRTCSALRSGTDTVTCSLLARKVFSDMLLVLHQDIRLYQGVPSVRHIVTLQSLIGFCTDGSAVTCRQNLRNSATRFVVEPIDLWTFRLLSTKDPVPKYCNGARAVAIGGITVVEYTLECRAEKPAGDGFVFRWSKS